MLRNSETNAEVEVDFPTPGGPVKPMTWAVGSGKELRISRARSPEFSTIVMHCAISLGFPASRTSRHRCGPLTATTERYRVSTDDETGISLGPGLAAHRLVHPRRTVQQRRCLLRVVQVHEPDATPGELPTCQWDDREQWLLR